MHTKKIIIPGGAGLVGQNLVVALKKHGYNQIVVIDKHEANLNILSQMHNDITTVLADLSVAGDWQKHFENADCVIMLQAQIGGNDYQSFVDNNITASRNILSLIKANQINYLCHISSSVVESVANDYYSGTKSQQEQMVKESQINTHILRPTLMFGWFDRKHLGWLNRFMLKIPVFPIPGNGRYMRQPLYVMDFCQIIIRCIENSIAPGTYNISGHEKIDYIDMIRTIKAVNGSRTLICKLPYSLFYLLLWIWGKCDANPPFTTQQLKALVAGDEFECFDWPKAFNVSSTPFKTAIEKTLKHPRYSHISLEF